MQGHLKSGLKVLCPWALSPARSWARWLGVQHPRADEQFLRAPRDPSPCHSRFWTPLGLPAAGPPAPTSGAPEREFSCLLRFYCAWWFWPALTADWDDLCCYILYHLCVLPAHRDIGYQLALEWFLPNPHSGHPLPDHLNRCPCWEKKPLQNHHRSTGSNRWVPTWPWCPRYLPLAAADTAAPLTLQMASCSWTPFISLWNLQITPPSK